MRNLTASARPKRSLRQRDRDRAGGQVFVLDEIQAIRADLGWPQEIGRSAEMTREPGDLVGIRELGAWCEVEDLHVLGHAAAKCGHGQIHCEMKSATRRRRMISQAGCQEMGDSDAWSRTGAADHIRVATVAELPRSGLV